MKLNFENTRILITGGTGSWGTELTKQLLANYDVKEIIIYSRGELAQVMMGRKFIGEKKIKYVIGDVRDLGRLTECMKNIDYVFHLAALKHVPVCEDYPEESVKTNVVGTQNVITAAKTNNVKMVIDVSTDKACNPINVYGSCKSLGEKLILQANDEHTQTKFVCIRAGNVMGTNGSIIPLFKDLLLAKKTLNITSLEMTRYFMTVQEAIGLVFRACGNCFGGEIYVMKMPACKIIDLAKVMSKHFQRNLEYNIVGIRPGEKVHEELVSEYESPHSVEDEDFRIILPMDGRLDEYYNELKKMKELKYTSNDFLMNEEEIEIMLKQGGFLD